MPAVGGETQSQHVLMHAANSRDWFRREIILEQTTAMQYQLRTAWTDNESRLSIWYTALYWPLQQLQLAVERSLRAVLNSHCSAHMVAWCSHWKLWLAWEDGTGAAMQIKYWRQTGLKGYDVYKYHLRRCPGQGAFGYPEGGVWGCGSPQDPLCLCHPWPS